MQGNKRHLSNRLEQNLSCSSIILAFCLVLTGSLARAQSRPTPVRTAYSALSAGIGTLWLTQEEGHFKKHGLDSNLIYIRGGTTAVQALLAGEIHFDHLSPAPMMTAWAQGADFVWIGTTTHQMVFTLIADSSIAKVVALPSPNSFDLER
jgi:ABC-type nitrate/sulfonate/bicarbonate transport system substrate-binding protein